MKAEYINPILTFLICAAFAFVLVGIKGRKQISAEDEKGLNWFIGAFLLFSLSGFLTSIAYGTEFISISGLSLTNQSYLKNENVFVSIRVILSTLNSVCFLKAISYIQVKKNYPFHNFISDITTKNALIYYPLIVIGGTIAFAFLLEPKNKNWIWIIDILFSLLSIAALAIVIRQAFVERNMQRFQYLVFGMLSISLISQLFELHHFGVSEIYFPIIKIVISISYKIIFCFLILILLYSWEILKFNERINQEHLDYLEVIKKSDELTLQINLQETELQEVKFKLESANEKIHSDSQGSKAYLYPTIEFVLTQDNYGIRITQSYSNKLFDIRYENNLVPFKRLLRLAVYRKFGKDEIEQSLEFIELNLPGKAIRFTPKDKALFELLEKKNVEVKNDDFFMIKKKDKKKNGNDNDHIIFNLPPANITLPRIFLSTDQGALPEEIFNQFLKAFPFLSRERG